MPFGLSNAPITFMRLMNHVFRPFIERLVVVYFDDILIYYEAEEENLEHFKEIIQVLEREKFYGNLKNCTFFTYKVTFLRYIVNANGIDVDESKVEAIRNWPVPKGIHDVRSFNSLTSYYKWFTIKNFRTVMAQMTEVIKRCSF